MSHLYHVRGEAPRPRGRMSAHEIAGIDAPELEDVPAALEAKNKRSNEVAEELNAIARANGVPDNMNDVDAPIVPSRASREKKNIDLDPGTGPNLEFIGGAHEKQPGPEIAIDILRRELAEISAETQKTEVSFFRRFVNGGRDVATAAGSFVKEAGTALRESANESIVVSSTFEWARNMWGWTGKPGERLKTNVISEVARSVAEVPGAAVKGAWEVGDAIHAKVTGEKFIEDEFDAENFKPRSTAAEAFAGAAEILGTLATAAGLGREGSKGIPRELAERAIEAPAYIFSGFTTKALELGGKLSGRDRKEKAELAAELQRLETGIIKDYSPEADWTTNLVGRTPEGSGPDDGDGLLHEEDAEVARSLAPLEKIAVLEAGAGMAEAAKFHAGGLVDWGKDSAKAVGYLAQAVRDWFTPKTPEQKAKVESNEATLILPKASELVTQRLEINAAEATEIIQDAQQAKSEFAGLTLAIREKFLKKIEAAEAKVALRIKQINNERFVNTKDDHGNVVDAEKRNAVREILERDKANLEARIDRYKEKIAQLDQRETDRAKSSADDAVRKVYEAGIVELQTKIAQHEKSLTQIKPDSKSARTLIEKNLTRYKDLLAAHESTMASLSKLDKLTPETKKESAAA